MNLLVDMGNTRLKWAQGEGNALTPGLALVRAADLSGQLNEAWRELPAPQRIVAASVAGAAARQVLHDWARRRWPAASVHFVTATAVQLGVTNHYRDPARLGADRWAALIGARAQATGPVCVVDCGTAVTLDALDAAGAFMGGVIVPGLALARQSLRARTAGVTETDGDDADCFARSTADGVAAGTLFGLAGAVERVVTEFRRRLGDDMGVLLTGGDAPRLEPLLAGRFGATIRHAPDLVLQGLARIADTLP